MSNQRYELSINDKNTFNPSLLYLTKSEYGNDWISTPHFHPYMEIIVITNGAGKFFINDNTYKIEKGDLVVVEQNTYHTEISDKVGALEYTILGISKVTLIPIRDEFSKNDAPPIFHIPKHLDKIMAYIDNIYSELTQKKANYETMINSMLAIFLIYIMRHTDLVPLMSDNKNISSRECAFVKSYIDKNYTEDITLEGLATKSFISKYHLAHAFTSCIGMSPIQYLIARRLTEAKTLLETTKLSVTSVARNVGFSSPAYFSLQFKKKYGLSPLENRKNKEKK